MMVVLVEEEAEEEEEEEEFFKGWRTSDDLLKVLTNGGSALPSLVIKSSPSCLKNGKPMTFKPF
jgi:hypothetical protein